MIKADLRVLPELHEESIQKKKMMGKNLQDTEREDLILDPQVYPKEAETEGIIENMEKIEIKKIKI